MTQNNILSGGKLFSKPCEFMLGVVAIDGLPAPDMVEVAFAGRSNVGKSSLINALTGQKNLARQSNTPGRTQEINFFRFDPSIAKGRIVDLPGYGYARESKKRIAIWNRLLRSYLRGRPNLRRAFVLVDARHGLKANDLTMLDMLDEAAVSYQIILSKSDKIKVAAQEAVLVATQEALRKRPAAHPDIILSAAHKNIGLKEIRTAIAQLL
ncbi:MAG: YihA family ribosome biogenesis GTP-binding protein [Alphaproteobacteria bacterium]|nr:YihA family ribosome biogenesis GTP-binding protein [Alphaproteobacteria bacterium]